MQPLSTKTSVSASSDSIPADLPFLDSISEKTATVAAVETGINDCRDSVSYVSECGEVCDRGLPSPVTRQLIVKQIRRKLSRLEQLTTERQRQFSEADKIKQLSQRFREIFEKNAQQRSNPFGMAAADSSWIDFCVRLPRGRGLASLSGGDASIGTSADGGKSLSGRKKTSGTQNQRQQRQQQPTSLTRHRASPDVYLYAALQPLLLRLGLGHGQRDGVRRYRLSVNGFLVHSEGDGPASKSISRTGPREVNLLQTVGKLAESWPQPIELFLNLD